MRCFLSALVFGGLIVWGAAAHAASIGDPAPALTVERWIKGSPVRIAPGNVFVVEFWATWCPPCKRSIPHLTALQKQYASKGVIFIGMSDEPAAEVTPFVASQGENMGYCVGVDPSKLSFRSWMTAYGQSGIPHAFVVDTQGRVVWHGFPDEDLDKVLEAVTAGRFDLERERGREAGERLVKQYTALVSRSNASAKAAPVGEMILTNYVQEPRLLYQLAKAILTDPAVRSRDLELALRVTTKLNELTQQHNPNVLEMHARALFASGKKAEAVRVQKKAIELNTDPADLLELQKFLSLYEKGAQPGAAGAKP